ncbi:hypothetical protein PR048_030576 [Dryococelus australis]|uniref:Uncharacterized protein n=1 Tax=Dryococelus australis TaxID=614101 RepID=A0ABQ9G9D1_9NEOP|nr:hypothetical protein PR048_030576 [Dryococelus australis]
MKCPRRLTLSGNGAAHATCAGDVTICCERGSYLVVGAPGRNFVPPPLPTQPPPTKTATALAVATSVAVVAGGERVRNKKNRRGLAPNSRGSRTGMKKFPVELQLFVAWSLTCVAKLVLQLLSVSQSLVRGSHAVFTSCKGTIARHENVEIHPEIFFVGIYMASLLAFHQGGSGSIPGHSRTLAYGNRDGRCRWPAGYLGDPTLPPPAHSGAAPYSPQSTSSALKTSLFRAAQISSLTHIRGTCMLKMDNQKESSGEPGSIPGQFTPVESVGRRVLLGDLPFPPPFHSGAAQYSPRFTLISSQDFDVESSPNLPTQLKVLPPSPAAHLAWSSKCNASVINISRLAATSIFQNSSAGMKGRGKRETPENPRFASGIVRDDFHMRKSEGDTVGDRTLFAQVGGGSHDGLVSDTPSCRHSNWQQQQLTTGCKTHVDPDALHSGEPTGAVIYIPPAGSALSRRGWELQDPARRGGPHAVLPKAAEFRCVHRNATLGVRRRE